MNSYSLFSYKKGSSILHRCPAWIKILCVPILSILLFILPTYISLVFLILQTVLFFAIGFTIMDLIVDLRPVLYYAILLYLFQIITFIFSGFPRNFFNWESEIVTLLTLVRLFALMQCASLLFKTSTSLQLREGVGVLFGQSSSLTNAISMFLIFIPMVSLIYNQTKRSYIARGGKIGPIMFITILPILFSVGMRKAYNLARAFSIRVSNLEEKTILPLKNDKNS